MNKYNDNNTINRNHDELEGLSLDELRENVLNNPASFSTPPEALLNPEYVENQNQELLERFQAIANKITTDNQLAQEKLAETFQQYIAQHTSFFDSLMQWFSLTPFLKWILIVGLVGLSGVSAVVLFKFLTSKSSKMLEQPQAVVTYRFLWGMFEYTKPYSVDRSMSKFVALKYFYKSLKYLFMGK
jgi:hypothetical protein